MPKITAFNAVPRKQDRYVIEVDGEKFAVASLDIIQKHNLHIGDDRGAALLEERLVQKDERLGMRWLQTRAEGVPGK